MDILYIGSACSVKKVLVVVCPNLVPEEGERKKKLDSSLEKVILDGIDRRRISSALAVTKLSKKFISIHELGHFCTLISGVLIVFLF